MLSERQLNFNQDEQMDQHRRLESRGRSQANTARVESKAQFTLEAGQKSNKNDIGSEYGSR